MMLTSKAYLHTTDFPLKRGRWMIVLRLLRSFLFLTLFLNCSCKSRTLVVSSSANFGIDVNCKELDSDRRIMTGVSMRHLKPASTRIRMSSNRADTDLNQMPSSEIFDNNRRVVRMSLNEADGPAGSKNYKFSVDLGENVIFSATHAKDIIVNGARMPTNSFTLEKGSHSVVLEIN